MVCNKLSLVSPLLLVVEVRHQDAAVCTAAGVVVSGVCALHAAYALALPTEAHHINACGLVSR